jgi:hypothetical protein
LKHLLREFKFMKKLLAALTLSLMASTAANAYIVVQSSPNVVVVPGRTIIVPQQTYVAPVTTPCGTGSLVGSTAICVTNATAFPLVGFQVHSHTLVGALWGTDLLNQTGALPPGQSRLVNINDGSHTCVYDIHIRTASGAFHDYYSMNVCARSNIVLQGW